MKPTRPRRLLAALVTLALVAPLAPAQSTHPVTTQPTTAPADPGVDKSYLRSHFTKTDVRVPMRDGVMLHTAVYVPKDTAGRKFPVLLLRTPYGIGPNGPDQFPDPKAEFKWFARDGFIFVLQDVRGRHDSGGVFAHARPLGLTPADERTDAWDTIDWIVRDVPANNGRVGIVGNSYPGFYAVCAAVDPHPALKCAVPQAPVGDWFLGDDIHRNGALNLASAYLFLRSMGDAPDKSKPLPTADGYQLFLSLGSPGLTPHIDGSVGFWDEVMSHPNYDAYWKAHTLPPRLKNVPIPTLTVGGWYDAEDLYGTLETFRATFRNNPASPHALVIGPWSHGAWNGIGESVGDIRFGANLAADYRRNIELPFLKQYLEPGAAERPLPAVTSFDAGARAWQTFAQWPPKGAQPQTLYFHADGTLSPTAPTVAESPADEFASDPNKPVPYYDRVTLGASGAYMTGDQRFASTRPDVLTYQTPPLAAPLTVAGAATADLRVSTSGTDSDWIVKLIDVYPPDAPNPNPNPNNLTMSGYQQLVRLDILPARFRTSFEVPAATTPNEVIPLRLTMIDTHHTFLPGHRLMIQVQGSCFPLFARNPQTYLSNPYTAPAAAYVKSVHRLHHAPTELSFVQLPVLPSPPTR